LGKDSISTALTVWLPMSRPINDCFLPKNIRVSSRAGWSGADRTP
jgi:hypothetical protein